MPTRLRVDIVGYYHIINKGVNRCDIFNNNDDKEMFLQILNKSTALHKVIVHDYCLMNTMMEENVVGSAGVENTMAEEEMIELIRDIGEAPAVRNTAYEILERF